MYASRIDTYKRDQNNLYYVGMPLLRMYIDLIPVSKKSVRRRSNIADPDHVCSFQYMSRYSDPDAKAEANYPIKL